MSKILSNNNNKYPKEKASVSDYSLYKRILGLTKGFLETPKPRGALECWFCFIICSSEAEEDRGVTSNGKFARKDDKIPKGEGEEVGTRHLFIRHLLGVARKKRRPGSFKTERGVSCVLCPVTQRHRNPGYAEEAG